MRILILGHKGMLGSELLLRLLPQHEVTGYDLPECDIASRESCWAAIEAVAPEVVINAAAFTDVDGCETQPERCFAVNAAGVVNLAAACRARGALLIHFSTDYVFDGTKSAPYVEDDECRPLNVYGQSKLAGERFLRESGADFLLVRTAWLYGRRGKNFVRTILAKARAGEPLAVVNDQIGSPTYAYDLARAVQVLLEGEHRGVFHVTNRGTCSWHQFAVAIVKYAGLEVAVKPIGSEKLPRPARRPAYSVLSNGKFIAATGKTMRYWQLALQDCLEHLGYTSQSFPGNGHRK